MRDLFARKRSPPRYVVRCMKTTKKVHLYLLHPRWRAKFNWSDNYLKAHVFRSFRAAREEGDRLKLPHFQIVPVGYEGPGYWDNKAHVEWKGSMAAYSNPRVFLIDAQGKRIEV